MTVPNDSYTVPDSEYAITASVISVAPNNGVSYIYGYCRNEVGDGVNGKQVRVGWHDAADWTLAISGPHSGYLNWPAGYFSIPLFVDGRTPCVGIWDFTIYDPVRDQLSNTLLLDTDGLNGARNQYEVTVLWSLAAIALPTDEPDGAPAFLADKVRWWQEEMAREIEMNHMARAKQIMYSLIDRERGLLYRLERKLTCD
jgi:hypothetical protein